LAAAVIQRSLNYRWLAGGTGRHPPHMIEALRAKMVDGVAASLGIG
jgi:hypothetical protein